MSSETTIVGGRYELLQPLGSGSQGETFLARDPDAELVVVKKFTLASMAGWKSLELFQREIDTLRALDHAGIPTFIDAVEEEDAHYLVQQYIDGEPLSDLVAGGPFDEDELRAVARDVLEVLTYMHALVPPVIHRDLKPSNIIRRPDGSHVVVDFGGVQNIVAKDTGGSTVIGTTGYMPSEQLIGRAIPQSDIYALGATLAHLATGKRPTELPTKRLVLEWRPFANLDGPIADVMDEMLAPAPEDRPESAERLRKRLVGVVGTPSALVPATSQALTARKSSPFDPADRVRKSPSTLIIDLSPPFNLPMWLFFLALAGLVVAIGIGGIGSMFLFLLFLAITAPFLLVSDIHERLTIHGDGSFEHRWSDGRDRKRTCGQVRGGLVMSNGALLLGNGDGLVEAATALDAAQREWAMGEVGTWLEKQPKTGSRFAPALRELAAVKARSDR